VRALAALALLLAVLTAAGCGGDDEAAAPPPAAAPTAASDSASAAARRFLDRYTGPDGRVRRLDEGDDTVGEGQAYGMLLAAAVGDEPAFDRIWAWTRRELGRPDGLISFRWAGGRVVDPQAASDADVDAARALLVATCRFDRPALREEAVELGRAILDVEVAPVAGGDALTSGPWATGDPVSLNPSYFAPRTFVALAQASGDDRWDELARTAREETARLLEDGRVLPPDWATAPRGGASVPAGPPSGGAPPRFAFDAARTPVRFAEDPDPAGRRLAARSWAAFRGRAPRDVVVEHDLTGRPTGGTRHPVALVAAAGAAAAAGERAAARRLLDAAEALDRERPTYYGAAWVALGRLMLTTDRLEPCEA
jgi:endoglucanase